MGPVYTLREMERVLTERPTSKLAFGRQGESANWRCGPAKSGDSEEPPDGQQPRQIEAPLLIAIAICCRILSKKEGRREKP